VRRSTQPPVCHGDGDGGKVEAVRTRGRGVADGMTVLLIAEGSFN
jgi:hypothetical protein